MTARKAPAKKSAPSTRTSRPAKSQAAEIAELRQQVAALTVQVDNLAKFIAAGVAQQLQAQLMGSPDLGAQLQAIVDAQQNAG